MYRALKQARDLIMSMDAEDDAQEDRIRATLDDLDIMMANIRS